MTVSKVKRSQFKTFLNTTPSSSDTWVVIGGGAKTLEVAMNPETTKETYVTDDNATVSVDSYGPTIAVEEIARNGDPSFEFIDALRKSRAVLDAAETYICNVWMYESGGPTAYPAEKQKVSIQIDKFGGDGGQPARISYTINYIGDPIPGTFNAGTSAFTAS